MLYDYILKEKSKKCPGLLVYFYKIELLQKFQLYSAKFGLPQKTFGCKLITRIMKLHQSFLITYYIRKINKVFLIF